METLKVTKIKILASVGILSFLLILSSCRGGGTGDNTVIDATVSLASNNDFYTTVAELQGAIAENNLVLLKEYNVQTMMKMVDKKVDLFSTYQTFHPRYGKTLMETNPDAFTVTPLSFLVKQDGQEVFIVYNKPSATYRDFDLPGSLTDELDQLFQNIASKASGGNTEISIKQRAVGSSDQDILKVQSSNDFYVTVANLQGAIASNNLVLLKEYNVQTMMKMVDKKIDLFSTFQTFHPRYGKTIIENNPDGFTSTPLSFVVKQEGSNVWIIYQKPSITYQGFELPTSFTDDLDQLFLNIAESAAQGSS